MRWFMEELDIPLPFFDWGSVYCNVSSTLTLSLSTLRIRFLCLNINSDSIFWLHQHSEKLIKSLSLFLSPPFHECLWTQLVRWVNSLQILHYKSFHTSSFQNFLSIVFFLLYEYQNVKLHYYLNICMRHFPYLFCCFYFGHPHNSEVWMRSI